MFFFTFLIAFLANSSANATNLFFVRLKEYREGIPVLTEEGREVGISKIAGKTAVLQTALTRAAMPILPLFVPTISFYFLAKFNKMPKSIVPKTLVQTFVFLVALTYAPPMACGFFP